MMRSTSTKPVLRFPEFKEDWKECKLSDFLTRYSETNKDEEFSLDEILSLSSHYGIVSRKELLEETYSNVNHLSYKKTRLNDLVYGKSISASYPYGLFRVNDYKDGLLSTLYYTFKVKENVFPKFIDCYFSHLNRANNFLRKYVLVGDRYITADADYLLSGKIFLPTQKEEQKKITDFLIQIDKRIAQLTQKKENLELYKKGITQKIFSQKLRFKDENGKDFPEWKYLNGNKLFEPISNKNHNSDLPILAISQEFGAVPREMINYHISVTEKSVESYKVVEKGDYIISLRSFQGGIEYSEYKGICSPAYIILRPKVQISDYFFKTYFKTNNYIQELCRKLEGIRDGKMISYKYFSEIKLPFPHIKEQEKIASFLNEISKQIALVNEQLEETRTFKKALLSKLFC
jgi:type I restriction enzyme S subunit